MTAWMCPRCQQENERGDRYCFFCRLDHDDLGAWYVEEVAG